VAEIVWPLRDYWALSSRGSVPTQRANAADYRIIPINQRLHEQWAVCQASIVKFIIPYLLATV